MGELNLYGYILSILKLINTDGGAFFFMGGAYLLTSNSGKVGDLPLSNLLKWKILRDDLFEMGDYFDQPILKHECNFIDTYRHYISKSLSIKTSYF